ncbi:hypothetical protein FALCPG4_011235 [Fusarium falciforme]
MASTCTTEVRERRTLRRSRYGCRNCKLRKLKCDESKPQCKRCCSFGVLCNFMPNIPDLHPVAADTAKPIVARGRATLQPALTNAVWSSDSSSCYQLSARCQDFITRYLGRSLLTPGDPNMLQVNRKLLELAFTHPFLMHASLAVAFTYDRHLNSPSDYHRTREECYHWSQSAGLFHKRLSEPIAAKDKDPIWGTAAALAVLSFSSPEATSPEESWPLKSSGPLDLNWLRLSEGKMALWHTVNPLRPDSLFHVMAATYAQMYAPFPERGTNGVPIDLAALCRLDGSSTSENNPYFDAVHGVSRILDIPDDELTTGPTQLFFRSIRGQFKDLLWRRDPIALLLLYLWYRKGGRSIWWIELRARVECPSICSYLRLYHGDNCSIQAFLPGGALADKWN